jgi:hypothetical protein
MWQTPKHQATSNSTPDQQCPGYQHSITFQTSEAVNVKRLAGHLLLNDATDPGTGGILLNRQTAVSDIRLAHRVMTRASDKGKTPSRDVDTCPGTTTHQYHLQHQLLSFHDTSSSRWAKGGTTGQTNARVCTSHTFNLSHTAPFIAVPALQQSNDVCHYQNPGTAFGPWQLHQQL